MGRWSEADMASDALALPAAVEALLSDDTPRDTTSQLWAAFRACFETEDEAVAAACRNAGTIMPYLNRPTNIVGSFEYLVRELGLEAARDVVRKNPGVLQCDPRAIAQSKPSDIVRAANSIDAIESLDVPPIVRNNADKLVFLVGAAVVAKRLLVDCAGQSCGGG